MIKLKEGIDLSELMGTGTTFTINLDDMPNEQEDNAEDQEIRENLTLIQNLECLGLKDEESYVEGEPFEMLSKKMTDLIPSGKVKKYIIREGCGEKPPDLALVKVHYNAYIEYESQPFDSTHARKRTHNFRVNNGEVLIGLDIAVQSMKLNEKAQFLISPEMAYGKLGCLGRVPGNSTILFELELIEIVNSGASLRYEDLPEENKNQFAEVYKYCQSQNLQGKELVRIKNYRGAVKEYNIAVSKLEKVVMQDYSEQEKQQALLLKLYTNLLICHTMLEDPKKGCMNANKIFEMCKGTELKVPAKVFFNNSRCLRFLGEYRRARRSLLSAQKLEPNNQDIAEEFIKLDQCLEQQKKNEEKMAKALVN